MAHTSYPALPLRLLTPRHKYYSKPFHYYERR
ncbi:hypothetical protein COLO4_27433 [Corchorus olitorius]|uniref:Uncharacterized protein n=1 Tax=Corchorus olitorius TaxID=93759 RepID=A0A1R3HR08_9ROSI|nr:hypothetical protein COLO4_27433 [Corchorus olitorius]